LKDYYMEKNLYGEGLEGFNIVKSDFEKTGFVFEIGSSDGYDNFESFKRKLMSNTIKINWENFSVEYSNSKGDHLKIQYNSGLEIDPDGLANSIPQSWINGKSEIALERWPVVQSPVINLSNRILNIKGINSKITVDWTGEFPKINKF